MTKYKPENDPTNADAIPLYLNHVWKFWAWFDGTWSCTDWVTWHKAMKAKYGKAKADQTFLKYWNDLALISSTQDCRSFSESFRTYMKSENLLDALYSGLGNIARPLGVGTDVTTGVGNAISGAAKGLGNVGNILKVALPIALIAAIGVGGYWAYKHYIKE